MVRPQLQMYYNEGSDGIVLVVSLDFDEFLIEVLIEIDIYPSIHNSVVWKSTKG
jgi:hypothetical protein